MSTSITIAAALINWNELWTIILAAVIGDTGVVIVFGLMLLGVSRGKTRSETGHSLRALHLSGVCGFIVVAVAAVGIHAMTQKPSSAKPKPKAAAALGPAGPTREPPARTAPQQRSPHSGGGPQPPRAPGSSASNRQFPAHSRSGSATDDARRRTGSQLDVGAHFRSGPDQ